MTASPRPHRQRRYQFMTTLLIAANLLGLASSSNAELHRIPSGSSASPIPRARHAQYLERRQETSAMSDVVTDLLTSLDTKQTQIANLVAAVGASSTASSSHTSSSGTASSSSSAASASASSKKSSNSYVKLDLPDSFVQCQPAVVGIESVIGSKDIDMLGADRATATSQSWLELEIRIEPKMKTHLTQVLAGNTTSWEWTAVDLPAGTSFALVVSSVSYQNDTAATSSSAPASSTTSTRTSKNKDRRRAAASSTASDTDDSAQQANGNDLSPEVLAHTLVRSDVVAGDQNITTCLSSNADDGGGASPQQGRPSRKTDSDEKNRPVIIVGALLGGLVTLFLALLVLLAIKRRRENRASARFRAAHPHLAGAGQDRGERMAMTGQSDNRMSQPVALWDGGYRNSPSAGWNYMSSLVPGLNPGEPPAFLSPTDTSPVDGHFTLFRGPAARRRQNDNAYGLQTRRRREDGEEDLPSYGKSEEERKGLPGYEPGAGLRRVLAQEYLSRLGHRGSNAAGDDGTSPQLDGADSPLLGNGPLRHEGGGVPPEGSTTVLTYIPSGPSRPYSTLETTLRPNSEFHTTTMQSPARAEVNNNMTLSSVERSRSGRLAQRERGAIRRGEYDDQEEENSGSWNDSMNHNSNNGRSRRPTRPSVQTGLSMSTSPSYYSQGSNDSQQGRNTHRGYESVGVGDQDNDLRSPFADQQEAEATTTSFMSPIDAHENGGGGENRLARRRSRLMNGEGSGTFGFTSSGQ